MHIKTLQYVCNMNRKWNLQLAALISFIVLSVYIIFTTDLTSVFHSSGTTKTSDKPADAVTNAAPARFATAEENAQWTEGKSLFKSNCAACHNPKADGTGPALNGVTARWNGGGSYQGKTGEQWLYAWVKNWRTVKDAGYPYGVTMANSRGSEMNVFTSLNDKQIANILFYVEHP